MLRCGAVLLAVAMIAVTSIGAVAQQATTPPPQQPDQVLLKPEQLEAQVAPIALYPDELLANVLAASTYPLEVVQAEHWLKEHKSLEADALKEEVDRQSWDDSVKALASTPDVIALMSEKLDWTKDLGDAVLAQQPDVMDAVQRLRAKAYDNKKLATSKQQKVSVQTQESRQVIVIGSADAETMYVPYYDPAAVYGTWAYADYPASYFAYPSYIGAGVVAAGLAFGAGWAIGRWGNYWGGGCNWGNRNLYINHYNRAGNVGSNWQHNPAHRQGVLYNNAGVQQKFGNNNLRAGAADRSRAREAKTVSMAERTVRAQAIAAAPIVSEQAIAPKPPTGKVIAPKRMIAPRGVETVPRAATVPKAARPALATVAGATPRSAMFRLDARPIFNPHADARVSPALEAHVAVVVCTAEAVGLPAVATRQWWICRRRWWPRWRRWRRWWPPLRYCTETRSVAARSSGQRARILPLQLARQRQGLRRGHRAGGPARHAFSGEAWR
jgi:hypothetical protein